MQMMVMVIEVILLSLMLVRLSFLTLDMGLSSWSLGLTKGQRENKLVYVLHYRVLAIID